MPFSQHLQNQFQTDPVYQNAIAVANRDYQTALGGIQQNIAHGLLQLGNPQFARAFYTTNWLTQKQGKGKNAKVKQLTPYERAQLAAIRANAAPGTGSSTFAQIGRSYALQQEQMNNELNNANLFYSGYRGKELGRLGREEQLARANALYGAQGALDTQLQQRNQSLITRNDAIAAAAQAAYIRLLAQRLGGG